MKIYAAGTVCVNRFPHPPFLSNKDTKIKSRGYLDEVESRDGNVMTKWKTINQFFFGFNFVGEVIEKSVNRWNKT
jgi:hypothetical protein